MKRFDIPPGSPGAMSVKDAAKFIGIGEVLAYKLVRRGDLPSVQIGRGNNARRIIPTAAIMEWLSTNVGEQIDI